jgi:flagellar hook protein FlgE
MSGILTSGVTGLQAMQQMLDVTGNNLANSNTTGFKAQSVEFSDLLYQTYQAATGATADLGGTNPVQVGTGVQVATISNNLQQGALETTGNQLDMALQGNGYFVVNNGVENLYTRAGSFSVNSQGYLVDPATGDLVQRFGTVGEGTANSPAFQTTGNDGIKIPSTTEIPGQATSTITIQGNLPATATGPLAQVLTSSQAFTSGGTPATGSTLLNSLDDNTAPYQTGDTLQIQGTTAAGTAVNATLSVGPTTTMADLVNAINADFTGSTASLNAQGNLVVTSNTAGPSQLAVSIGDSAGNKGGTSWNNQSLAITTTGKDGDTATAGIQFYDAQGSPHTLTLTFQKQANNTWTMTGSIPATDGTMVNGLVSGITFNANGSFGQVTGAGGTASMTVALAGQATPQTINFNLGTNNSFNGLTQVGTDSSAAATQQNGYGAGTLSNITIDQTGVISGVFTNGQVLQIAQLAVANFANPQGLNLEGNNYYSLSSSSGPPLIGGGNSGGRGTVQQSQLEDSNVDVSLEFTKLIIAQRGYELDAHSISAGDQVLQDLVNMIR